MQVSVTEIRKEEVMAIRNRFPTKIPVRRWSCTIIVVLLMK